MDPMAQSDYKDDATAPKTRDQVRAGTLRLRIIGENWFRTAALPERGMLVLGRGPEADIRIDDPSISRRHAVLHIGPELRIEDLGSVNGTRVGDQKLDSQESITFSLGELIELGSVMLLVQRGLSEERPRRIFTHDYFESRLEEECARAALGSRSFAVLFLRSEVAQAGTLLALLAQIVDPTDVIATYGPGQIEALVTDVEADQAATIVARLREGAARLRATARVDLALFPRDARTPEALLARARAGDADSVADAVTPSAGVTSDAMAQLHRLVDRIAASSITVLLLGETGVGKDVMAQSIHARSPRAQKPFLRLNCAALPESLVESELFGHERGAFTGATQPKPGLLEAAQGGTVLLDEVGELPLPLQAKLLRVFEEQHVLRVGALNPRSIDVRFIAATNRDLEAAVQRGVFRQDLYFRLNGVSLLIPPLRERVREIEPLARRFIAEACEREGRSSQPELSEEALQRLLAYPWPGNIRELRNVIDRAVLLCTGDRITTEQLPRDKMNAVSALPAPPASVDSADVDGADDDEPERERILQVLAQCGGNQSQAAKQLGMSRNTLLARLDRYGVPRPRKR